MLLKRQNSLRCFLNLVKHSQDKSLIMAYLTHSDPFYKGLLYIPQPSNSPLLKTNSISIDNGGHGRVELRLRGCSNSFKQENNFRSNSSIAPQNQVQELEEIGSHNGKKAGYLNGYGTCQAVVAVDVDEVLGNFVSALNKFIADRYSSFHSVSEYHVYEFFKIWNCSRDEANIRVHEFFKTTYFKSGILPLPGAQKALDNLSRLCKLSVVTSRQNVIKDHTIDWIEKHYPGVFQDIHFGNHFALDGESKPKSEICRSLGATVLIDDNPRYALECAEVGIRVLLFDYEKSYPWCKSNSVDRHPLVTRVHNWEQVEQQLLPWIDS